MPRMNQRGRYYNYPNLRANMDHTQNQSVVTDEPILHAMNELPQMDTQTTGTPATGAPTTGTPTTGTPTTEIPTTGTPAMGVPTTRTPATGAQNTYETQPTASNEMYCRIRFFNAAAGYGGLSIVVGDETISENLMFGMATDFVEIPSGFQQVTIQMVQEPEAVLLSKRLPFRNCMNTTAAIINTSTGIDVMMIPDVGCDLTEEDRACFRVANLSYTSPPLDVILENGSPVFEDVRFKYVTDYKQVVPGEYNFNIMLGRTAELLKNNTVDLIVPERPMDEGGYPMEDEKAYAYFFQDFEDGDRYTAYIIGNKDFEPPLSVETLEEKD